MVPCGQLAPNRLEFLPLPGLYLFAGGFFKGKEEETAGTVNGGSLRV